MEIFKARGVIVNELGKTAEDVMVVEACKKTCGDIGYKMVNPTLDLMGFRDCAREGRC